MCLEQVTGSAIKKEKKRREKKEKRFIFFKKRKKKKKKEKKKKKRNAINCAVDFMSILYSDVFGHCRLHLSHELMTALYPFSTLHFNVTRMSLASWIERQEPLSFAYKSWKKCMRIAIFFFFFFSLITDCFYLCVVNL